MSKSLKTLFGIILSIMLIFSVVSADNRLAEHTTEKDLTNDVHIQVPILLYHNIMDGFDIEQSSVQISPALFEEHMFFLQNEGYNTITFGEYYKYVIYGDVLPEKPIIITFDDGYESNYEYAFPILKRLGMKATIFVITDRRSAAYGEVIYPHFTWEQAREMQESGIIDIESHSDSHRDMTMLSVGDIQLELRRSRYLVEKHLNKSCDIFAYPYGQYNEEIQELAQKAGYKIQVVVGDNGVNRRQTKLQQLKRLTAFGNMRGQQLLNMIEKNMEKD